MSTDMILLRNTISKVTAPFEASYAKRLLADPHYGKILVEVESEKPEVLGQPTIDGIVVDDEGNAPATPESPAEPNIERGYDKSKKD